MEREGSLSDGEAEARETGARPREDDDENPHQRAVPAPGDDEDSDGEPIEAEDEDDRGAAGFGMAGLTLQQIFALLGQHDAQEARLLLQQLMVVRRPVFGSHEEMGEELFGEEDGVKAALLRVKRAWFVPNDRQKECLRDAPVEIPEFCTNLSAPHIYPAMLRQLGLWDGARVLDVGSGTGYMSALCASIVGPTGRVTGWEVSPKAVAFARAVQQQRLAEFADAAPMAFEVRDAFDMCADAELGSFDAIIVGSSLEPWAVPHLLTLLRRPRGVLVAPINDSLTRVSFDTTINSWTRTPGTPVRFRDMLMPAPRVWSPQMHRTLPMHFRRTVFCVLCIWRHHSSDEPSLSSLPRELLLQIIAHIFEQPLLQLRPQTQDVNDDEEDGNVVADE